ncbi:MAG: helix-turn-helix domain-containing protein [Candidatus Gastranaerophilales bacterium]|nr:helix-turn-helix domain-containing protein [Candidatus Gastranaerophilales bacterium]
MSEYLSKEEIKKWRSSVEKITLEEYAQRLGKKIQEEKKTNDLADMLYQTYNPRETSSFNTMTKLEKIDLTPKLSKTEAKHKKNDELKFDDFAELPEHDAFDMENDEEIMPVKKEPAKKPEKIKKESEVKTEKTKPVKEPAPSKAALKTKETAEPAAKKEKTTDKKAVISDKYDKLNISFVKPLTDREEKVLDYFISKKGEIVYAKELAELLDLKRDYIYKYIKNLRAKMAIDVIKNSDNSGFTFE